MRRIGDLASPDQEEDVEGQSLEENERVTVAGREIDPEDDLDYGEELGPPRARRKVPHGDIYEAARAGDVDRLRLLLEEEGVDVNVRDRWDSVPLYYACLAGHVDAAKMLLEAGAICSEHTFDGDRCHYAALTLRIRKTLKAYEMRPPPMDPLPKSFRELFNSDDWWPDVVFHIMGRQIKCHRAILSARSPYFAKAFQSKWKHRKELKFANPKLTFNALYALVQFFYIDRLDIALDDMDDLLLVCRVCKCTSLTEAVEKEIQHQMYAEHKAPKALAGDEATQRRWIFQGLSLSKQENLSSAMQALLDRTYLSTSVPSRASGGNCGSSSTDHRENASCHSETDELSGPSFSCQEASVTPSASNGNGHAESASTADDFADISFALGDNQFTCHRAILAVRSEYFKALFDRTGSFREGGLKALEKKKSQDTSGTSLLELQARDLAGPTFVKVLEYIYTDRIRQVDPDEAEELFEAASRYLLFPLKRAVADALLPQLETATPPELCRWLLMADLYEVWKLREHCLDTMAANFEVFERCPEFHSMLRSLPPPSGDLSNRTTVPSAPGEEAPGGIDQANILDDLREKWLEIEGAELGQRDQSAMEFDNRLVALAKLAVVEGDGEEEGGEIEEGNDKEGTVRN